MGSDGAPGTTSPKATHWTGTLTLAGNATQVADATADGSSVQVTVRVHGLAVREGTGELKPLTDQDRVQDRRRTATCWRPTSTRTSAFTSTRVDATATGATVEGELTVEAGPSHYWCSHAEERPGPWRSLRSSRPLELEALLGLHGSAQAGRRSRRGVRSPGLTAGLIREGVPVKLNDRRRFPGADAARRRPARPALPRRPGTTDVHEVPAASGYYYTFRRRHRPDGMAWAWDPRTRLDVRPLPAREGRHPSESPTVRTVVGDLVPLRARRPRRRVVVSFTLSGRRPPATSRNASAGIDLVDIKASEGDEDIVLVASSSRQLTGKLRAASPMLRSSSSRWKTSPRHQARRSRSSTLDAGADGYVTWLAPSTTSHRSLIRRCARSAIRRTRRLTAGASDELSGEVLGALLVQRQKNGGPT